ncbi:MAG: hypothetical protein V4706_14760 [Pseudomonadota bacterium]
MGVELIEPVLTEARGTFRAHYSKPKTDKGPRLLDYVLTIAEEGDAEYLSAPCVGEFVVVDVVTREKAWFEVPTDFTPDNITGMIASTFAARAFRVGPRMWFV